MARAHRIGQTREVKIYRLLADRTYEQAIYDAASKKYGLDEAILGGLGGGPADAKRIASLLRDGAMALGDAAAADEAAAAFAAEDIDSILANRTSRHTLAGRAGNTFSVATFGHATSDAGDRDFWATVLPDAVAAHDAAAAAELEAALTGERSMRAAAGGRRAAATYNEDALEREFSGRPKGKGGRQAGADGSWLKLEVQELELALFGLGAGRTADVRAASAELSARRSLDDVAEGEHVMLALFRRVWADHVAAKETGKEAAGRPSADGGAPALAKAVAAKDARPHTAAVVPAHMRDGFDMFDVEGRFARRAESYHERLLEREALARVRPALDDVPANPNARATQTALEDLRAARMAAGTRRGGGLAVPDHWKVPEDRALLRWVYHHG